MQVAELERLVAPGESETLELKTSTGELTGALRSACAFLNGRGGTVVIGASPKGKLVGQQVSDQTQQQIAQALTRFEPPAPIALRVVPLPGTDRAVVVLEAAPSPFQVPFVFEGRAYERVGSSTVVMPQERYQRLLLERAHATTRWETGLAEGARVEHLDHEQVLRTVRSGIETHRLPASTGQDALETLRKFGVLRPDGAVLNGAVVLFGSEDILRQYPQCEIRLARFAGIDKSRFLDSRQVRGHVFALLDAAQAFIARHLPVAAHVQGDRFERVEQPLIPIEALREALVNAFAHRDYAIAGGAVSLAVYDDRWEIWSTGMLPFGLRVEDLTREHASQPRNPLIADVLYRHGLIERWGRGTQKIVALCLAAGGLAPEFSEQAGSVVVRFPVPPARTSGLREHDMTQRQRELLDVIRRLGPVSLGRLRDELPDAPAERTVQSDLARLRAFGLVTSEGRGRGARYAPVRTPWQ